MSSAAVQTGVWPLRRWITACLVIFAGQVALIFWLGERSPISPRPSAPSPVLSLVGNSRAELLALRDPTLFALPRHQGFAGLAWLTAPDQELPVVDWTESPRWLELRPEQLGASFHLLTQTNLMSMSRMPPMPEPELGWAPETISQLTFPSAVRVEGSAPLPRLLSPIQLPSWPPKMLSPTDADLLTNSVVEVMMEAEGRPIRVTLLTASGSKSADDFALSQARNARFDAQLPSASAPASSPETLAQLRWCRLIFEWQTRPGSNAPAARP